MKVIFGKGPGGQPVPKDTDRRAPMWKKKSIFWELEYWKVLDVRSAIDVMHVTKNICVNLLSSLGVYGKTNDTFGTFGTFGTCFQPYTCSLTSKVFLFLLFSKNG